MAPWCMITVAVVAAAFIAGPAAAQNGGGGQDTAVACTTGETRYAVGDYACLPVCYGVRRLVRCDLRTFGNDTVIGIWTYVSNSCPSVMIINPRWPDNWTQVPPVTEMNPLPVIVNFTEISPEIAPKIGSSWNRTGGQGARGNLDRTTLLVGGAHGHDHHLDHRLALR